ncbi:carbohydrate kinase family protein [Galbibacter pacificus]|uniref:Carbohydrate kinase n=1 Tax=Galbibacter pacificus TaxID=2996052 RepID=A0ABT6FMU1_9FLAO|nr:carbohydrate kinase [Galbibacter pacificus]MDG3581104.1 carbohydrate kinase [Galbibacter pacificus]MDG3584582.1 carbohydrate kinase [Galbibacter pacificus]
MKNDLKITCFGEVLWDVFPDGEKIGGAPLNVALRLQSFGVQTTMISSVGKDIRGKEIITYLNSVGINTNCIAVSAEFPTGVVNVNLDENGSASYEIKYPVAWDKIPLSSSMLQSVTQADAFIYGSLVCRDSESRKSLINLLSKSKYNILDVNLRQGYYSHEILIELMKSADFIKFNDDELFEIGAMMGSPYNSLEQNLEYIKSWVKATSFCVTKGRHGALLFHKEKYYYNSGYKINVKDTVGAGDSFLASLLTKLLEGENPQRALDFACGIGALVAAESGANPILKETRINNFINGKENG